MNRIFTRILALILCLGILVPGLLIPAVQATETEGTEPQNATAEKVETPAENISGQKYMTQCTGFPSYGYFFDKVLTSGGNSDGNGSFTVAYEGGVGSIYIIFQKVFGDYTVTDNDTGTTVTVGEGQFLHDFLDMWELFGRYPTSVTVDLSGKTAYVNEVSFYTPGQVPSSVQQWKLPKDGETDLILFPTHGDDEQLFFAGILPYYAGELGYQVQVVYFTDHLNNSKVRMHEMLNGLWTVGVTTYPVFGHYEDFRIDDKAATYNKLQTYGHSKDDMLRFVVEQLRRFKPKVIIGHDFAGEYGHGQHIIYAELVAESLTLANDPEFAPELVEQYGLWDVPKAYFHLYKENEILLDWDQPLESFNGMTAFQVTQKLGFLCHESQQWTWFPTWINGENRNITKASQIKSYSPCRYGLYHSTVGLDVEKNDFFENITTYAEDYRIEQERLEQERLEQERLEKERLEKERLEQERLEKERLEQERLEAERKAEQ